MSSNKDIDIIGATGDSTVEQPKPLSPRRSATHLAAMNLMVESRILD
jgi:hypothetical protein